VTELTKEEQIAFLTLREQLDKIKQLRKKRRLSSSRLNKHLEDILNLYLLDNASNAEIALWLRQNKRIVVTRQAVSQFINRHIRTIDNLEQKHNG
jgi:predicted DNA-binding protein YlxM (UPF0122 family)